MPYEVRLEVFEGPLDLLLHLITRQKVDIYEVSLSTITDEYLRAIDGMALDLESATGFLVVAASLLELKSARLLPSRSGDDGVDALLEERDLLLARLVECATYRTAGEWISAALASGAAFVPREVALEERFQDLAPDVLARVSPADVARAAADVLAPKPLVELDTSHIAPITASVKDAIVRVAAVLAERGGASFAELCPKTTPRIEVVVRFIALLELLKAGAVELSQATRFGEIHATWTGEGDVDEVVLDAEEYALMEEQR
ncbi:MAG: segregation/condensation protein A [Actinomycetota bacterium]|nr:segregation/condensation protein A [Actinomycetota bacterium]